MTLVWLALILAVIVWAFVYITWDIGFQFRRQQRALNMAWERDRRRVEDEAWAAFRAETRVRERALTDALAAEEAVDLLTTLMRPERLEVVA